MTWDDIIDRMRSAELSPVEEIYVDNYGNSLPLDYPEFQGRFFRLARGVVKCNGLKIEAFVFPSEGHLQEFMEVIGDDPWWVVHKNIVLHFPVSDPAVVGNILDSISSPAR